MSARFLLILLICFASRLPVGAQTAVSDIRGPEGIWQVGKTGARLRIERINPSLPLEAPSFAVFLLSYSDTIPAAETAIGILRPTAAGNEMEGTFLRSLPGRADSFVRLIVKLNSPSQLTLRSPRKGIRYSVSRLLPYLYRFSLSSEKPNTSDSEGCIRVWPDPTHEIPATDAVFL